MKQRYLLSLKRTTAFVPAMLLAANFVHANPLDGQVVAGSATITAPSLDMLLIQQTTNNAIINWKSFDIGAGETTQFVVPDYTGVTLNRVVGSQDPSKILGTLKSNGTVMVVNPDGILFGPNSVVDVGGLLATTADIDDADFMAKNYQFTKQGKSTASIVNQGMITVKDEGIAALVAPGVRNEGVITAKLGKVTLGAANKFSLDFYGDDLIKLMLDDTLEGDVISTATGKPLSDKVANTGKISANGGTVVLKAATARKVVNSVINNTGVIEANSVGVKNGKIMLFAATAGTKQAGSPVQSVKVSGTLSASGKKKGEKGGKVLVTGEAIEVSNAKIDASGDAGGGAVLIGGDYLGHKATDAELTALGIAWESFVLSNATFVSLDDATSINVDAGAEGNGGKAVVWSDGATISSAKITAKGGAVTGNGGFIETSGKYLDVSKAADASAANGVAGTWLLDPLDVHIANVAEVNVNTAFNVAIYNSIFGNSTFPTGLASIISVANVEAALNSGTNVRVTTRGTSGSADGNIYIDDDITKSAGGNVTAVIDAANDVIFASGVDLVSTSGSVNLGIFAKNGQITGANMGQVNLHHGALLLEASDGITFKTNSDAPDAVIVNVVAPDANTPAISTYDIRFDQDVVKFTHDHNTVTVASGGVRLRDPTSFGYSAVNFYGYNVQLADYAVSIDNHHSWDAHVDSNKAFGAIQTNALNGAPEITFDGVINNFSPTVYSQVGIAPVFEAKVNNVVNAVNPVACKALKCFVTGPVGLALINNYLNPVPTVILTPEINFNTALTTPALAVDPVEFVTAVTLTSLQTELKPYDIYAVLADNVYGTHPNTTFADGTKLVTDWKGILGGAGGGSILNGFLAAAGIGLGDINGFNANLYQLPSGQYVLAFEGSTDPEQLLNYKNPMAAIKAAQTWINNGANWLSIAYTSGSNGKILPSQWSAQYVLAGILADIVANKYGNVVFTGHSLGGGLAQMASYVTGNKAIVFNPSGTGGIPQTAVSTLNKNVTQIWTGGQANSLLQLATAPGEFGSTKYVLPTTGHAMASVFSGLGIDVATYYSAAW